ncbi:MAG: class D sortase [Clostridiales bacterium]|nr:class D sortase [Clostridiales bacterium]
MGIKPINKKAGVVLGVALAALGALIACFPWIKASFYEYGKNKLLSEWGAHVQLAAVAPGLKEEASSLSEIERNPSFTLIGDDGIIKEEVQPLFDEGVMLRDMRGIIAIEKINLRSPILKGDSAKNLDLGICELVGSPDMGATGNYVLAGHKSRIYGRHFSRLDELVAGDAITLSNGVETFSYEVIEKLQIKEEDTWILESVSDESIMTLITCDYTKKPIGRLAVKAKLVG